VTDLAVLRERPRLVDGVCRTLMRSDRARDLIMTAEDPFEQHVVRWCLENRIPAATLHPGSVHVVLYEDAVSHIGRELARLGAFLGKRFGDDAAAAARKPSRTDFRHRAARELGRVSPQQFLGEWQQHITGEQVEIGLAVLRAFELDHLYSDDPFPLVAGDEVLGSRPSARTDGWTASPERYADQTAPRA
jgi:hypothetical protein